MPTYEDIRSYFEEAPALREVVHRASEEQIVTGFTLNVHPLWNMLYDVEDGVLQGDVRRIIDRLAYISDRFDPIYAYEGHRFGYFEIDRVFSLVGQAEGFRRRDLYRPIGNWPDFLHYSLEKETKHPLVLTIVHRPLAPPLLPQDAESPGFSPEEEQASLRHLVQIAKEAEAIVSIEERPSARLALAPGDAVAVSNGANGTLGGVLKDSNSGKPFGVTCAHLASPNDVLNDTTGATIGVCSIATSLVALPANASRDPASYPPPQPYPGNGPDVNMLDCALIDSLRVPVASVVSGIAASLSPGMTVTARGANTSIKYTLGALAISYDFQQSGQNYLFRDSVELVPLSQVPIGGRLNALIAPVPTQGDSGAWVVTADASPVWAGMLFGEDGKRGFAVRASWLHTWAEKAAGCKLQV